MIYGIGTVAILAWSGILWVVRDVAAAVRLWRDKQEPVSEPRVVNVDDKQPMVDEPEIFSDPIIDAIETLAGAVKDIASRLEAIEAKPVAPKATTRRKPSA